MTVNLDGRHAFVTGGSSGIGAAVAEALAAAGATVTITGRRAAPLKRVCKAHPGVAWQTADVTDPAAVEAAFAEAAAERGAVSIVVANAGAATGQPFSRLSLDDWQATLDVNLTGVFNTFKAGLGHMPRTGPRRLIAIASTAGLKGYPFVSAYCAAKHGVVGLVRALALELSDKAIAVNAICPGYTETPMLERAIDDISAKTGMSRDAARAMLLKDSPTGRFVQPHEVAREVVRLCGPQADAITGQAIALAGGQA